MVVGIVSVIFGVIMYAAPLSIMAKVIKSKSVEFIPFWLSVAAFSNEASGQPDQLALIANFTFVSRDSKTGKSAPINQILPESGKEKLLWEEGEERNKIGKMKRLEQKRDKEGEEMNRVNELLAEGRIFADMPALVANNMLV